MTRVRIPADVDREDPLLAGLSGRQLTILAAAALLLWCVYDGVHTVLPVPAFAALATPVGVVAVALALGRRDGVAADRLVLAALRRWRAPRRLVAAWTVPAIPAWVGLTAGSCPAPLRLPVQRIAPQGVIDLGQDGVAVICRAPSLTLSLRTETEQEALVAAFGRWLDSLGAGTQIVVRSELADLTDDAASLEETAATLAHPDLEAAARDHADYLRGISRRDALRRAVFVVVRESAGTDADARVLRRADEARSALAACGIALTVLDGGDAVRALTGTWTRGGGPDGMSSAPVTGRRR